MWECSRQSGRAKTIGGMQQGRPAQKLGVTDSDEPQQRWRWTRVREQAGRRRRGRRHSQPAVAGAGVFPLKTFCFLRRQGHQLTVRRGLPGGLRQRGPVGDPRNLVRRQDPLRPPVLRGPNLKDTSGRGWVNTFLTTVLPWFQRLSSYVFKETMSPRAHLILCTHLNHLAKSSFKQELLISHSSTFAPPAATYLVSITS